MVMPAVAVAVKLLHSGGSGGGSGSSDTSGGLILLCYVLTKEKRRIFTSVALPVTFKIQLMSPKVYHSKPF